MSVRAIRSVPLNILSFMGRKLRRTPLTRLAFLNRAHAALSLRLYGSNEANLGPFRVRFDQRDRVIGRKLALYGQYEEHEIRVLCSLVKPNDHVLDIGANIGIYSLYLSRAVGPNGRVVAVEPDPDNLAILRANLDVNGCENVTVLGCAFGEESRSVDLFQDEYNRGGLSLADLRGGGRSVSVPMRRGEEAIAELQLRPSVAKIDVEGAEPVVISGLGPTKPNIILFEFVPLLLRALDHNPEAFLESLEAEGYKLELIERDNGARIRRTPSSVMRFTQSSNKACNILATR